MQAQHGVQTSRDKKKSNFFRKGSRLNLLLSYSEGDIERSVDIVRVHGGAPCSSSNDLEPGA